MTSHISQGARFLVAGGATFLSNLAAFIVAVRAGAPNPAAAAVGVAVSFWVSFFLNRHWAFRRSDGSSRAQIGRFTLVVAAYYGINVLLLSLFRKETGMPPELAQLLALALLTPASYIASSLWVYRSPPPAAGSTTDTSQGQPGSTELG